LSRATLLKLLADATRAYQSLVPRVLLAHVYQPADSPLIANGGSGGSQTFLAVLLDRFLPLTQRQHVPEVSTMARVLICSLSDCYQQAGVQQQVAEELHAAVARALAQPDSAEKHTRLQVLMSLFPNLIESPMLYDKVHMHRNTMYRVLLRQGVMTYLTKVAQYKDLSNHNTLSTLGAILRPMEILLRFNVATTTLGSKRILFGGASSGANGGNNGNGNANGLGGSGGGGGANTVSAIINRRLYPRLAARSAVSAAVDRSNAIGGEHVLRDIIRNVLSDRRHAFEFIFNSDEMAVDSEDSLPRAAATNASVSGGGGPGGAPGIIGSQNAAVIDVVDERSNGTEATEPPAPPVVPNTSSGAAAGASSTAAGGAGSNGGNASVRPVLNFDQLWDDFLQCEGLFLASRGNGSGAGGPGGSGSGASGAAAGQQNGNNAGSGAVATSNNSGNSGNAGNIGDPRMRSNSDLDVGGVGGGGVNVGGNASSNNAVNDNGLSGGSGGGGGGSDGASTSSDTAGGNTGNTGGGGAGGGGNGRGGARSARDMNASLLGDVSTSDSDSEASTENDERNAEEEDDDDDDEAADEDVDEHSETDVDEERPRQFIEVFDHIYEPESSETASNDADVDAEDDDEDDDDDDDDDDDVDDDVEGNGQNVSDVALIDQVLAQVNGGNSGSTSSAAASSNNRPRRSAAIEPNGGLMGSNSDNRSLDDVTREANAYLYERLGGDGHGMSQSSSGFRVRLNSSIALPLDIDVNGGGGGGGASSSASGAGGGSGGRNNSGVNSVAAALRSSSDSWMAPDFNFIGSNATGGNASDVNVNAFLPPAIIQMERNAGGGSGNNQNMSNLLDELPPSASAAAHNAVNVAAAAVAANGGAGGSGSGGAGAAGGASGVATTSAGSHQNNTATLCTNGVRRRLLYLDQQYCVCMPTHQNPTEETQMEIFTQDGEYTFPSLYIYLYIYILLYIRSSLVPTGGKALKIV